MRLEWPRSECTKYLLKFRTNQIDPPLTGRASKILSYLRLHMSHLHTDELKLTFQQFHTSLFEIDFSLKFYIPIM